MKPVTRKKVDSGMYIPALTLPNRRVHPTAGVLFNRPNPRGGDGDYMAIDGDRPLSVIDEWGVRHKVGRYDPEWWPQLQDWGLNERGPIPVYGHDCTSVPLNSAHKYRIPDTSVVNKVGHTKLFCCCGVSPTAAQWVWATNLVCMLAHTAMVFVVLWGAYWRWDRSIYDTDHVIVRIYRISPVPTQEMIDTNATSWTHGRGWNLTESGATHYNLRDNNLPVNFATLTLCFFLCSALAHAWAVIAGLFERWWFIYWRQMDRAFHWWRWLEYSVSAGLMAIAIAIALGLREQSALAGIFWLHWSTMGFGFLVEYYSRPVLRRDGAVYRYPVGKDEVDRFRQGEREFPVDYDSNERALMIIDQSQWATDQSNSSEIDAELSESELVRPWGLSLGKRASSYVLRMVPHVMGIFPLAAAWIVIITHLEWLKRDFKEVTTAEMPEFVNAMLYGSFLIFWSFGAAQVVFQFLPPGHYWGTEIVYCVLSLTAKLWLGLILLLNVLMVDGKKSVDEALSPQ